ncbi:hypothetical protein AB0J83_38445 [Actinoplanes sp. NPDC049596]|uniref:hypothetical protein n=1 Tax=unclassified Actinoplanes TaxID=2626549 RepID=UPI003445D88C
MDEDDTLARAQVGAWRQLAGSVRSERDALVAARTDLVAVWPPEENASAAAFVAQLDNLITQLETASADAETTASGLDGIVTALAGAKTQIRPLWEQYKDKSSDLVPNWFDRAENEIDEQARQFMINAERAVQDAATLLKVPPPFEFTIEDVREWPPAKGSARLGPAGIDVPVPHEPVPPLPGAEATVPDGSTGAAVGGAAAGAAVGLGAGGFSVGGAEAGAGAGPGVGVGPGGGVGDRAETVGGAGAGSGAGGSAGSGGDAGAGVGPGLGGAGASAGLGGGAGAGAGIAGVSTAPAGGPDLAGVITPPAPSGAGGVSPLAPSGAGVISPSGPSGAGVLPAGGGAPLPGAAGTLPSGGAAAVGGTPPPAGPATVVPGSGGLPIVGGSLGRPPASIPPASIPPASGAGRAAGRTPLPSGAVIGERTAAAGGRPIGGAAPGTGFAGSRGAAPGAVRADGRVPRPSWLPNDPVGPERHQVMSGGMAQAHSASRRPVKTDEPAGYEAGESWRVAEGVAPVIAPGENGDTHDPGPTLIGRRG